MNFEEVKLFQGDELWPRLSSTGMMFADTYTPSLKVMDTSLPSVTTVDMTWTTGLAVHLPSLCIVISSPGVSCFQTKVSISEKGIGRGGRLH